jgi:hypothetical protein
MKKILATLFALSLFSTAQSENYYSANVMRIKAESEGESLSYNAISGTFGTVMSESVSGELRFGIGLGDDSLVDSFGDTITSEIDYMYGAYLKFDANSGNIKPYAILGLTKFKASSVDSSVGVKESGSEDDFSYGVGIDFENGLNLEYTQYYDKDGVELNGLSLGMKF